MRSSDKMRGNDGSPVVAKRLVCVVFLLIISILSISIGAEDKKLVDFAIGDFDEDYFLIKYGKEKTFSIKNSIEMSVRPMDVILLLDVSISMKNYPSTEMEKGKYRIDIEKRIATQIVSEAPSYSRIAVIQFGDNNKPALNFTDDKDELQETIDNLEATGMKSRAGEKLNEAVTMASQHENPCMIVLVADGIEAGGGLYIFSDFTGRAKVGGVPIFCALINPDIDCEEFEEEIVETHGILTVIQGESDVSAFAEQVENVVSGYGLKEFTIQVKPSSDIKDTAIEVVRGNSLSQSISGTTVRIGTFSPDTEFELAIEPTVDVEKYSEPQYITPYSVVVTFINPVLQEKVTLPEIETSQIRVEFESLLEYYKEAIMLSILGAAGIMGIVIVWGYSRHQKGTMAKNLVNSADKDVDNYRFGEAIEKLKKATEIYSQLRDPIAEKLENRVENLKKNQENTEKKKSEIMRILTETQNNLEKSMRYLRTERYVEEFFPSFSRLRSTLDTRYITSSTLTTAIESIRLKNDPEDIDRYFQNLEKFSRGFNSQFLAFDQAQNLYENENSRELIELLLEQYSCLDVADLEKAFFEEKEVARLLLNLWKLDHPEKKGEFDKRICSEEKEGYELFAKLKDMYRDISQRLNTLRKEASYTFLEFLNGIATDIDETVKLSQVVLQEFSPKYEETLDPEYKSVVEKCKEIQGDLVHKGNDTDILKKEVEKDIEIKIGSLNNEFEDLKRRIKLGDYQDEVINSLYKLQSKLQSIGMLDLRDECRKITSDLERKLAIVEFLNNTKAMSIPKLCENLELNPDETGKTMVQDLCRQIITEKNRRSNIPQYQLFTEYDPDIFLDFNLLAQYTLDVGKAPSEIETDIETLLLPKEVCTDLINVLKRGQGDARG
jgi:hypothetical protein